MPLKFLSNYFGSIPPVFLDGLLYCLIALFTFCQSYFGGDEAAKYLAPEIKFWINAAIGSAASVCAALKMFRSTSYAEHREKGNTNENHPATP